MINLFDLDEVDKNFNLQEIASKEAFQRSRKCNDKYSVQYQTLLEPNNSVEELTKKESKKALS
jgi:hypothetical protein